MMNFVVVCAIFLLGAIAVHGDEEKMAQVAGECIAEVGMTPDQLKMVMKDDSQIDPMQMGCFYACTFKKFDLLKDGEVNVENMKGMANEMHAGHPEMIEKSDIAIEECAEKTKGIGEECEFAMEFMTCLKQAMAP